MVNLISKRSKKRYLKEHFIYEVKELHHYITKFNLIKEQKETLSRGLYVMLRNMEIEHTLLHIRVLYEFYFINSTRGYPRAENFIDTKFNSKFDGYKGKPSYFQHGRDLNKSFYDKVNNQVTHLGSQRTINKIRKQWHLVGLVKDTLTITKEFLTKLDSYYYKSRSKKKSELELLIESNNAILKYLDVFQEE